MRAPRKTNHFLIYASDQTARATRTMRTPLQAPPWKVRTPQLEAGDLLAGSENPSQMTKTLSTISTKGNSTAVIQA